MFLAAFFAVFLLVVAVVVLLVAGTLFSDESGVCFMLGIIALAAGCSIGAWSFMLFVHAAQLA